MRNRGILALRIGLMTVEFGLGMEMENQAIPRGTATPFSAFHDGNSDLWGHSTCARGLNWHTGKYVGVMNCARLICVPKPYWHTIVVPTIYVHSTAQRKVWG